MNAVTIIADKDVQWKESLTTESTLVRRLLICRRFFVLHTLSCSFHLPPSLLKR